MCDTNSSLFREKRRICESPPRLRLSHQGWGDITGGPVSLCFREALHLVLSFSEGNIAYVAVDFLCPWEEVSSESPYATILNCLPWALLYYLN